MDTTGAAAHGTAVVSPQLLDDQLAALKRSWLAVAGEVAPDASQLPRLLGGRLDEFGRGRAPTEYDLLSIAEDAAQAALQTTSADNARVLSKLLRRAVYEFLLAVDAAAARVAALGGAELDESDGVIGPTRRRNGLGSLMIGLEEVSADPPVDPDQALRTRPELVWDAADVGVPLAPPQAMVTDAPRLLESLRDDGADLSPFDAPPAAPRRPPERDAVDGATEPRSAAHWHAASHPDVPAIDNLVPWPQALRESPGDAVVDDGMEAGDPPPPISPVEQAVAAVEPEVAAGVDAPQGASEEPSTAGTVDLAPPVAQLEWLRVEADAPAAALAADEEVEPETAATAQPAPAAALEQPKAEPVPPAFRREPDHAATALVIPSYRAWADVIAAAADADDEVPVFRGDPSPRHGAPAPPWVAAEDRVALAGEVEPATDTLASAWESPAGTDSDAGPGPEVEVADAGLATPAVVYPLPVEHRALPWLVEGAEDTPRPQPAAEIEPGDQAANPELGPSPLPAAALAPAPDEAPEPEVDVPWGIVTPSGGEGWPATASGWHHAADAVRGSAPEGADPAGSAWLETAEPVSTPVAGWPAGTLVAPPTVAPDRAPTGWSVRTSPRKRLISERLAERRRDEVVRAAVEATDGENARRRRRDRDATPLMPEALALQVDELVRRKKGADAGALLQRAAQEIGGRPVADLALEGGDRVRDLGQTRAAISCYLAAWRADPLYEAPLWRLADTCLVDRSVDLAVGYLERIAALMRARGDDDGAIDVYRKIMAVAPDRAAVRDILRHLQATGRLPD